MGLDEDYENADVVIVPVPYEETVFYRRGTKNGPAALLDASTKLEHFDFEEKRNLLEGIKIHTAEPFLPPKKPEDAVVAIEEYFSKIFKDGKFPVALGGEHSISAGIVNAAMKFNEFSVLQLDAHSDLRDEFEGSRFSHACPLRRIRENTSVVQVGVRSMSKEEYDFVKKEKIERFIHGVEFDTDDILEQLSEKVYITIDLDAFDPSEMPGIGSPEPGGMRWSQVSGLIKDVSKHKKIIGCDVVELAPIPDNVVSEFTAAKLVYRLIGYSRGSS